MSTKFLQFNDEDKSEVSVQQANSIYEVTREALREQGQKEADQKYFINSGRKAVFNLGEGSDKSIASIGNMFVQINEEIAKPEDPASFNVHKLEAQFLKYMQVLDTDYSNYLVVYTCQENTEWTETKSGRELLPEEAFQAYLAQLDQQQQSKDKERDRVSFSSKKQ
eukprot:CAMPEP_0168615352 /NCGR_PEP_ID=MMETSP0449_2-20121227/4459_1 /TAXON_ID=1082188 /ORGANISM="Strombidium rassoulzadegani, Strain ras09" /LENGTH=165 /DNA_ID=CAMNT_0008656087 /DNA_START=155 /DNA_END=649 /DNA_ORIENTATION=+